jgi:hypothetical protein
MAQNISDVDGVRTLFACRDLPLAQALVADRRYDARWISDLVYSHGMEPGMPLRFTIKIPVNYSNLSMPLATGSKISLPSSKIGAA